MYLISASWQIDQSIINYHSGLGGCLQSHLSKQSEHLHFPKFFLLLLAFRIWTNKDKISKPAWRWKHSFSSWEPHFTISMALCPEKCKWGCGGWGGGEWGDDPLHQGLNWTPVLRGPEMCRITLGGRSSGWDMAGFFVMNWCGDLGSHLLTCSRPQFDRLWSESIRKVSRRFPPPLSYPSSFYSQHLYFLG